MNEGEPVFMRIARIVAASGVAAGAVAGLAGAIVSQRRSSGRERVLDARLKQLDDLRNRLGAAAPEDAGKFVRESIRGAAASAQLDKRRWNRMKKSGKKDATKLLERVRDSATEGKDRIGGVASETYHDATNLLAHVAHDSRGASEQAREAVEHGRSAASDQAKRLRRESGQHWSDLEKYVVDTLDDTVMPNLTKAGRTAAHVAEDLRSRLSTQLDHLGEIAQDRRPQVSAAADQVSDRISQLLKDADSASDDWLHTAERAMHDAEGVIQENAQAARQFAGEVGDSAREGTRNFGSLLFWLVVAGGLVYAMLMDEEQKRKSRELASAAFREGREIYRDVRGRDADFGA